MQAPNAANAILAFWDARRRRAAVVVNRPMPYAPRAYAERTTDYRQRDFLLRRFEESQYWTLFQELCDGNLAIYWIFLVKF